MSHDPSDTPPIEPLFGTLERSLIDEFVRAAGHDPHRLAELPEADRAKLLTEASIYASSKLTEVESRSQFVHDLHEARPGHSQTGLD